MRYNLAVYTAQEGYSWQPGTAFTAEELVAFKKCIGKFPSPDSAEFPFGGIFLLEDRVVFYRYHVAKKIDFRGRDALYCVLGAVSREEAAKTDPAALFACPEFAGPMKPFPVSVDVPEADPVAVPEWLKNLDEMTLDVRITGTSDNPSYAVVQNPVKVPEPSPLVDPEAVTPAGNSGNEAIAENSGTIANPEQSQATGTEEPPEPDESVSPDKPESVSGGGEHVPPRVPLRLFLPLASAALLAVATVLFWVMPKRSQPSGSQNMNGPVVVAVRGDEVSNAVSVVTSAPTVATNAPTVETNVTTAATNNPPAAKDAPVPSKETKSVSAPSANDKKDAVPPPANARQNPKDDVPLPTAAKPKTSGKVKAQNANPVPLKVKTEGKKTPSQKTQKPTGRKPS